MSDLPTLGQRVRELRHERALSYRTLAALVGVDRTSLSRIEHDQGRCPISAEKLAQLATVLGTDPDELIALAGKLPPDIAAALRDPTNMRTTRHALGLDKERT